MATRSQMQANLQSSLIGFRQDLARELAAVCVDLRGAADDSGSIQPEELSHQFQHWQQTAARPALVSNIYLWQGSSGHPLLRLDPARVQMESAQWPDDWHPLLQRLEEMTVLTSSLNAAKPLRHFGHEHQQRAQNRRFNDPFFPSFIDQSIPALVYPARRHLVSRDHISRDHDPHPELATPAESGSPAHPLMWVIIQLNPTVLEKETFPELAQRYFRGPVGLDYRVAVLAGANQRVLYSSDSAFAESSAASHDASVNLFGPPSRRTQTGPPGQVPEMFRFFRNQGPRPQADDKHSGGGFDQSFGRAISMIPLQYPGQDSIWQLVVQHQRGSLEAAVSRLRWRHLLLSFGVLMLLAVTIAMVLIASQRARRLAALQMNFLAGVSHELRTPLAVISSAAENIAHGVVSDNAQVMRYGTSILRQARQLTQLVEQVLLFATTGQKFGNYLLRRVDVCEVIEAAIESTSAMASAAGVTVKRRIEMKLPPVAADFGALSQCLQNLITNAIKYGGDARWLEIRADARRESGAIREVELTVSDKGIGISPVELKHIFEPFYRSPAVAGSNVHGTGLGLPLAWTVIEAMHGRLTVSSEPGKGSAFTIHLPVATGLRSPEEEPAAGGIPGERAGYYS